MTKGTPIHAREHEGSLYASNEDFHTIFNEDLKELYQLSFLLTRDPAKAERCLVSGLLDCVVVPGALAAADEAEAKAHSRSDSVLVSPVEDPAVTNVLTNKAIVPDDPKHVLQGL
jgi:hypothetical protein